MIANRIRYCLALLFAGVLLLAGPVAAQVPGLPSGGEPAPQEDPNAALQSLLDVLRDEASRGALIADLEAAIEEPIADLPDPDAVDETLARQIATTTAEFAEQGLASLQTIWRDLSGVGSFFGELSEARAERFADAWLPLLLTAVSTVAILWGLTRLISVWRRRRNRPAPKQRLTQTLVVVVTNALLDATVLAIAYAIGLLLALTVFGQNGELRVEQSLFMNAFLVAGVARLVLRMFVLPAQSDEALSHLALPLQRLIYSRAKLILFLLVYGITVGVPVANAWVSLAAGRSVRIIAVTLAALLALVSIRAIARMVCVPRPQSAGSEGAVVEGLVDGTVSAWNRIWPWLATAYVIATYVIAVTQPRLMADVVGLATLKTLGAIGLLAVAFRLFRSAARARMPLPDLVRLGIPELKTRLDGFAPLCVRLIGAVLMVATAALFLDAWNILDVGALAGTPEGSAFIWRVISAALIVICIILLWAVISSWIDHRLNLDLDGANTSARRRTLLALFRNAFTVGVFIFGAMIALSQLGLDIAPLLAGAGVIGLAIGFGSQKLVQDIITGIFIQLENAMNEGDVVTVAGISGVVEKLTIRSVGLRDLNGVYHIVPFSSVDMVSNFMRNFSYHVEVAGVAYKEKIPAVKEAMHEAFDRLKETEHGSFILGDLEMHGVVAMAESSVNVRVRIKTAPGKQFALGRAYTELVKDVFDERDIEIPFPHRQLMITSPKPEEALARASRGDGAEP